MNIRCAFCQTPYTLSRVEMLDALQEMDSKNLTHYDAHCPRCRRATPIPRKRMEMFMPKWRDELKAFEAEMKKHPQQAAPLPGSKPLAEARQGAAKEASNPEPEAKPASKASKPAPKAEKAEAGNKPAGKKTPAAVSSAKGKKATTKKSK